MRLFVDASALVSLIIGEDDADLLADRLDAAAERLTSPLAVWESTLAVRRIREAAVEEARIEVGRSIAEAELMLVPIGEREGELAIAAHAMFGKSNHPARLNMADCFAYACAKANDARLLYKGDDFAQTDLAWREND